MKFSARVFSSVALLPLTATAVGLAAPAPAADRPEPSGAERWALRPVRAPEPDPAPAPALRGSRSVPLSERPGERRAVRVVYRGYGPAGALTPAR